MAHPQNILCCSLHRPKAGTLLLLLLSRFLPFLSWDFWCRTALWPRGSNTRLATALPTGRSMREDKDPRLTFAALTGGEPCKERYCVTTASPRHPAALPCVPPTPGHPAHPHRGTMVMWPPQK